MSTSPQITAIDIQKKEMQAPPLVISMADIKSSPPSPHQLATMTNVNVLDLHKDYNDATKVYDKETNTVYVYSNNKASGGGGVIEATVVEPQPQMSIPSHLLSRDSAIVDGRAVDRSLSATQVGDEVTRMVDNSFLQRLVESQEVISRDFVNGEAHIITRNENGEHVLTRIINPDPKLLADSSIFAPPPPPPSSTNNDHTAILHHDKNDNKHHMIYAAADLQKSDSVKQIIYTHGDKEIMYTTTTSIDSKPGEVYSAINSDGETVIYTTAGGSKPGLEVYQSGELGIVGENQVIIPGGLQYTAQPGPNGTTVYVLAEMSNDDSGTVTR